MRTFAVLFAVLIAIILIATKAQAAPEDKSGEDCYYEDSKTSVKRGEYADVDGECVRLHCSESGSLNVLPCEFAVPENCEVVDGDLSKSYPSCCPTLKCAE